MDEDLGARPGVSDVAHAVLPMKHSDRFVAAGKQQEAASECADKPIKVQSLSAASAENGGTD